MPVQNSNFKISARPDLAISTNLLQILIPATINSLVCQKGQFTLQLCPRRWFVRKIFGYYTQKVKIEKSSYKILPKLEVFRKLPVQETGRTGPQAKSLFGSPNHVQIPYFEDPFIHPLMTALPSIVYW